MHKSNFSEHLVDNFDNEWRKNKYLFFKKKIVLTIHKFYLFCFRDANLLNSNPTINYRTCLVYDNDEKHGRFIKLINFNFKRSQKFPSSLFAFTDQSDICR